jgi:hypothetical protein
MSDISLLVKQLSDGYMAAQVVVCVCFFVLGYAVCAASGMERIAAYLYAYPAGLAVYSVCSYLMLCLGIPFCRISISTGLVLIFLVCVWLYAGRKMEEAVDSVYIKQEALTFVGAVILVFAISALLCSNIFNVVVDNDTFYYFATFPEAIVQEGKYIKNFDTFLTDAAPIGSIVYTVPYVYGFGETFGMQYLMDLDFLLIFACAVYNCLAEKTGKKHGREIICMAVVTTLFLATSTAYLTTAKWIMAGVYFMSYYFMTAVIGYMSDREKKPYAVLILFAVMTAMLRHEGVILVLLLIVLLSSLGSYTDRELLLVYILPVLLAAAIYYLRVFCILGVSPLYAFLTRGKAFVILTAVVCTGLYILLCRERWQGKGLRGQIQENIPILMPALLLFTNLALLIFFRSRYLNNIYMFYLNLRLRAGWGYFPYIIGVLIVLCVILAIKNRSCRLTFYDSLMVSYVLGVLIVSFGRGDDLRKGVGDSGNRVLLTAVPVIVFAVALRLADRCIGGRDDRED